MPSSDLASSSGATVSLPQDPPSMDTAPESPEKNATEKTATEKSAVEKNVAEKKTEDLELVHIPLSVSAKRETAIMRLTNRIKALELNVSLSSR